MNKVYMIIYIIMAIIMTAAGVTLIVLGALGTNREASLGAYMGALVLILGSAGFLCVAANCWRNHKAEQALKEIDPDVNLIDQ